MGRMTKNCLNNLRVKQVFLGAIRQDNYGAPMLCRFLRLALSMFTAAALLVAGSGSSVAQNCTPQDISALIDSTAEKLRSLNAAHQPELQAKLRQLAEQRGWSEAERDARAAEYLADEETRALDEQASKLLVELDVIGDESGIDAKTCQSRLEKLKAISAELIKITTEKAAHVSAKLDVELSAQPPVRTARHPQPKVEPKAEPKVAARPEPVRPMPLETRPIPGPTAPDRDISRAPVPGGWDTSTVHAPQQPDVVEIRPAPGALAALPPYLHQPEELEFTVEEIRDAGRGFFGSMSAGLASVIEYAFQNYGRPNGYILGSEGGAALLAGLRYGDGRLVTKLGGERKVYWQGPSVGYDVGLAGSRVMFLVYNLQNEEDLFARFIGVDGSAYIVGGVGVTFLKKGPIVLAPIRTGLGLRVGANVGYLKFTPTRSINPF